MGALANFGVSQGSKQYFDAVMGPANMAMDFVRDHPIISKLVATAFPPAAGVIVAAEVGDSMRSVLGNADRETATKAYQKTGGQGLSLVDRVSSMAQQTQPQASRQRQVG